MKFTGSYDSNKFTVAEKVLANADKVSASNQSKIIHTPWGEIWGYRTSSKGRGRFYSVRKSKVLHNGGSYKMSTLKRKYRELGLV